jgi:DNA (cytosine-5)-methyltransferase 1
MNGGNGDGFTEDGPMYTLNATGVHGVAQPLYYESHPNDSRVNGPKDVAHPVHAFKVRGGCEGGGKGYLGQEEQAFTISATQDQQIAQPIAVDTYKPPMAIRRLTPIETELLQGFPRNWTKIPYRNKPADQCPDGPRYKACGNSMAVPVMRWIGQRIQLIDTILNG